MRIHSGLSGISRRRHLRQLGAVLSLPFLEALAPGSAWADEGAVKQPVPPRLVMLFNPHGPLNESWYPKQYGTDYTFSPSLQPLVGHRDQLTILSGLSHPQYPINAGHSTASRMLCGVSAGDKIGNENTSPIRSISMDQVAATHAVGQQTRFPSLHISSVAGTGQPGRSATLSFNAVGIPLPSMDKPRALFNRLFVPEDAASRALAAKRHARRTSVLDTVASQMAALHDALGVADQHRLGAYQESVREVEKQLQRDIEWTDRPRPEVSAKELDFKISTRTEWVHLMQDIMVLALRSDSTRVLTMMLGTEVDAYDWQELGFRQNWHALQHHNGKKDKMGRLAQVDKARVAMLARFADRLQGVDAGDGSLLDHTMIWFGHGMNNGGQGFKNGKGTHGTVDQAHVILGGRKRGFLHGQHLRFPSRKTPLCSLWVSMLQGMGIEIDSFVDGDGPLPGLRQT